MTASLLRAVVAAAECAARDREVRLPESALELPPPRPGVFRQALMTGAVPRIIAECKRRSPSRGVLKRDYDPAAVALAYAEAGAAAISVLTEPTFFNGSLDHLRAVRRTVDIPLLRKDFIVSRYQIAEARAAGADAVLLIVAAMEPARLRALIATATEFALDALVEVHDETEIDTALSAGATILGVNSRHLHTLAVDPGVHLALAARLPADTPAVAESGIRDGRAAAVLARSGYRACLVGERFMSEAEPGHALRRLIAEAEVAA